MPPKVLERYGWTTELGQQWDESGETSALPARVVADFGHHIKVVTPQEYTASVAGQLLHTAAPDLLPKVGDWVVFHPEDVSTGVIRAVFARKSAIVRKTAGTRSAKQVLAANVDVAFVVQALNNDFSLQRLDRYAFQLVESHIEPVFVFNKIDQATPAQRQILNEWHKPFLLTNAHTGEGVDVLRNYIKGKTAVFIGSSGVGKSTLVNQLLREERQKIGETRQDDRGRHTTSHRELFLVPTGGMIIDTPGIRELQLWGEKGSLEAVFPEIVELALQCRFSNCRHTAREKGCAVQLALREGKLSQERFAHYLKLRDELAHNT